MGTLRIVVKKKNGKYDTNKYGETMVYVQYGHDSKQCLFSTGIHVDPGHLNWIATSFRPFLDQNNPINKKRRGYTSNNSVITKKKLDIEEIKNNLVIQGIDPTIDAVRNEVNEAKKGVLAADADLMPLFDIYLTQNAYQRAYHYKEVPDLVQPL